MQRLGASILLVLVLSVGLHNLIIQAAFKLNQAEIAKTLCVEKDIKDSKCGGCCQLKKSLANENTEDGNMTAEQKQSEMISFVFVLDLHDVKFPEASNIFWPTKKSRLALGVSLSVFHPPDLV